MSKLSDYLSEKGESKPAKNKAIIKLKLAMLVKKIAKSKDTKVKSAFADHLENTKVKD